MLINHFRENQPFHVTEGRSLNAFRNCSDCCMRGLDKYKLNEFIKRHANRAVSKATIADDEDDVEID